MRPMELIIISDLHLSAGRNERTGKYSRNEDFFFDEEFKSFLQYLHKVNTHQKHLIIAGDMFDFLQVAGECVKGLCDKKEDVTFEVTEKEFRRASKFGFGTGVKQTIWKLRAIANGHKVFFRALANFLSKGHQLSIITGNHDIELYWREVQDDLRNRIADCKTTTMVKDQIRERIHFCPWFYYNEYYKTYVEHGNQYDQFNSFEYLLYPLLEKDSSKLWLPFGSLFVRYFFNKLEGSNPFADNIKPPTRYMRWAWKEDKLQFLKNIILYLPTMIRVFLKGETPRKVKASIRTVLSRSTKGKKWKEENDERIKETAEPFGLQPDVLKDIYYSLKASPFSGHKLWNISAYSTFTLTAIAVVAFICLFLALHGLSTPSLSSFPLESLCPFVLWLRPIAKWVWKQLRKTRVNKIIVKLCKWIQANLGGVIGKLASQLLQEDILEDALLGIKERIEDVQIIVTGHTHDPDVKSFGKNKNEFQYFNTGTWTTVFSEEERIIRQAKQFALVWIKMDDKKPKGELLQWNHCVNRRERLVLFEPEGLYPHRTAL